MLSKFAHSQPNMPNDTVVKVQEYKDSLILKAELLITKRFPEKIVQLNELLATPMFNERNFEEVHQDLNIPALPPVLVKNHEDNQSEDGDHPPTKRQRKDIIVSGQPVLALPAGTVPCNKPLCEMIKVVKPIIRKLVEDCKYSGCLVPLETLESPRTNLVGSNRQDLNLLLTL